MRLSLFLATFAATLSFTAPAWAQTSPDPGAHSPDPGVGVMQVLGYARTLEGQIAQLERRIKGMSSGTSKAQLETAIAGLRTEIKPLIDSKADQAALDALAGRVTAIETILAGQLGWYPDLDGDGHGDAVGQIKVATTKPEGYVARGGDCADDNADVNPAAVEAVGDGLDNDCDANTSDDPPAPPARLVSVGVGAGYRPFFVPGPIDNGYDARTLHLGVVRVAIAFDLARYSAEKISLIRVSGEGGGGSMGSFTASPGVSWCGGRNWASVSASFCGGVSYRRTDARAGWIEHPSWSSSAFAATLAGRVDVGRFGVELNVEPGLGHLKAWGLSGDTQRGWGFTISPMLLADWRF